MQDIQLPFERLGDYCREEEYRGWDVFDGLNSESFQKSPLFRFRPIRLAWIQLFKRSPINLRRVTGVPRGFNAKGLALFVSALSIQGKLEEARVLLDRLESMQCTGYEGRSWGYNFDWEARAFSVKMGTPNLVTTVFVANACLDFFDLTGDEKYLGFADEACKFILHHMVLVENDSVLCLRYIPGEDAVVHNAYMLGASLLGRVYENSLNPRYLEASTKAMRRGIAALRSDWSWPYGERSHHQFVDNFHTGFNLVSLYEWMRRTKFDAWMNEIQCAYRYWLETFFLPNGCPKYYSDRLYPIDVHCSAQAIVTCVTLQSLDNRSLGLANKIADWTIQHMQDEKGYFFYQKKRWYTNKIPYIRWSQAWMLYALSLLISQSRDA